MSAELPLLQPVLGPLVGVVARSVWTQGPMSPALLMNLYVAPAGGVLIASVAVSSRLFNFTSQLGVADEAFMVSEMPGPSRCMMWSRLLGSISMSSFQPQYPALFAVWGIWDSISRQVLPASSDNWVIFWPTKSPQVAVIASAMRVVGPLP